MSFRPSVFLRRVLMLDAVASGATGAMMIAGAGLLEGLLGLPVWLMREAGLILIPFVAFVGWLATRETLSAQSVWVVIGCNAVWTVASVALLVSGFVAPTLLGYAFVVAQAVVVGVFGELQYVGLRRTAISAA